MEVLREPAERALRPGDDQQARRVAVEPVHKPWADERLRVAVEVVGERVEECAGLDPERRVDEHARRLDDDDYVLVLEDDLQGRRLRRHRVRRLVGDRGLDQVARAEPLARAPRRAVDRAPAALDQARYPHAAQPDEARGQEFVEPLPGRTFVNAKLKRLCHQGKRGSRNAER